MSSGVFMGQRAKDDNVAIQVLECPGECQTCPRVQTQSVSPDLCTGGNHLVDTGNLSKTSAPEAFARWANSFTECR